MLDVDHADGFENFAGPADRQFGRRQDVLVGLEKKEDGPLDRHLYSVLLAGGRIRS